ncbi:hypothetical protein [Poseidonocella sp. HB161398]|uniref:hypothetical protein n=1 Tax=Poseidonocella sp. HB161398 TaxID=2320855 RepID=UPI001107F7F4|nr:hypothetical protein [Poseidonocella sp. HB161398]
MSAPGLHHHRLSGLVLPEGATGRDPVWPEARQPAGYAGAYDAASLVYDAGLLPGGQGVVLSCPRLFNLWPLLRAALPGRPRRRIFASSEAVRIPGSGAPLRLRIGGAERELPVRPDTSGAFAGRNVLLTMSRDNDPGWIDDWVRFHASVHGADAVMLFDNGSTRYDPAALGAHLAELPGIRAVAVFEAPFPYGPQLPRWQGQVSHFLQGACLNLARQTVLARARAVLNLDVDEMLRSRSGASVFDAAAARPLGAVKLGGEWVHPPAGAPWPAPQRAHACRALPPAPCHLKWCATPGGLLSRGGWEVHKLAPRLTRRLPPDREFELLHCHDATTGWNRGPAPERPRQADPELAALFARHLPGA